MKKLLASVIGLLMASAIGCSNTADTSGKGLIGLAALTGTGQVSFSFDETSAGPSKSIAGPVNAPAVTALVVTITDAADNIVYNAVSLPVTSLGGQYITQPLTLAAGSYHLTSFAAVNSIGEALYASPLEGSALAYLVSDPLPINFTITKNQVSKLVPEVLSTASYTAGDFGYGTFNFDIVETIDFLASVIVYNETSSGYELTDAAITVTSDTTTLYTGTLPAAITAVKVRDGYASYTVTVTKDGYADYTHTFTNAEIKAYTATPLTVTLSVNAGLDIHYSKTISYNPDNSIINEYITMNDVNMYDSLIRYDSNLTFLLSIPMMAGEFNSTLFNLIVSTSAGANGIWLDDDDTTPFNWRLNSAMNTLEVYESMSPSSLLNYQTIIRNAGGLVSSTVNYNSGADEIFYTADDTIQSHMINFYDGNNRVTRVEYTMADGLTVTSAQDLEYNSYGITKLTSRGQNNSLVYVKTIEYNQLGLPTIVNYFSDDEITQIGRAAIEYNAQLHCSKISVYNNAGTDNIWGTSDDVIGNVPNPIYSQSHIAFATGDILSLLVATTGIYPVATFEYDQNGLCIRVNAYSDDEQTLMEYGLMEYGSN